MKLSGFYAVAGGLAIAAACDRQIDFPQAPAPPSADAGVELETEAGITDAPVVREAASPPTLSGISPTTVPFGASFTIRVDATQVTPEARVLVDGLPATPAGTADSGSLMVSVRSIDLMATGYVPVTIENTPGAPESRSAPLFLSVTPPDGGTRILDMSPDNGQPGDTVRVLGHNLPASMKVDDSAGAKGLAEFDGVTMWGSAGGVEFALFTIPEGWKTGQPNFVPKGGVPIRGPMFNVGKNLTKDATARASSSYPSPAKPESRAIDNNLAQSWIAKEHNCVSAPGCTSAPELTITFPRPTRMGRIAMRGNREYRDGYNFLRGKIEILDEQRSVLFTQKVELVRTFHDAEITVSPPVQGTAVHFVSEADESDNPGLAEIEVFEN